MKIGIVGYGFVGKAMEHTFDAEFFIVDPVLDTTVEQMNEWEPSMVLVCVPTPSKHGAIDSSIVEDVVDRVSCDNIVIKSTITPDVFDRIKKPVLYWPEFLTEKNFKSDALHGTVNVVGGDGKAVDAFIDIVKKHSRKSNTDFIRLDCKAASIVKYTINTFLSTKVAFMNQMYDTLQRTGSSAEWNHIIAALQMDKRMGLTHMNVPGHDGQRGFGGTCFPKDTEAFLNYSPNSTILNEVIEYNKRIKKK